VATSVSQLGQSTTPKNPPTPLQDLASLYLKYVLHLEILECKLEETVGVRVDKEKRKMLSDAYLEH
jgi:hypothetical protein